MQSLEKGIDAAVLRNKAYANNLVNVSTPDYQRIEVSFEDEFKKALNKNNVRGTKTDDQHMTLGRKLLSEIQPQAYLSSDQTRAGEINNVDIDLQMSQLAENMLAFNTEVHLHKSQMELIADAIRKTK